MSFTLGVLLQVGQPPAVAVPPMYPVQRVIEAQVVSSSLQSIPAVSHVKQETLRFHNHQAHSRPQVQTYNPFGEKHLDKMPTGAFLDIFA